MGLGNLLVGASNTKVALYNHDNQASKTDGVFVACAAVDINVGLKIGASITLPGEGAPTVITAQNLAASIKKLAIAGSAYFLGKDEFKGSKDKATVGKEPATYGYAAGPRLTSRIAEHIKCEYDRWYGNEAFFNQLLNNAAYDWFFFTNNSVHQVLANKHNISYVGDELGYSMSGTAGDGISGTFGIMYVTEGFESGALGVNIADLSSKDVVLVVADPAIGGTGLTAGTCAAAGVKKYVKTLAGAATLTFATTPTNDCLEWGVFTADGSDLPTTYGTFNSITKVLTLPATMAAGIYTYVVVATNPTGVKGTITISLTVA